MSNPKTLSLRASCDISYLLCFLVAELRLMLLFVLLPYVIGYWQEFDHDWRVDTMKL